MKTIPCVRAALLVGLMALCTLTAVAQQGLNNLWMGGYETWSAPPWGGVDINFINNDFGISFPEREIAFTRTSANIADYDGNVLFSTNGAFVANALGDTMLNGSGLSPGIYTSQFPKGLHLTQACLILQNPDISTLYYLLHGTLDNPPGTNAYYLYLTTIDMTLDGGLGGVVTKNQVLITDTLNIGKLSAARHANGRDWWAFCHLANTNTFYRLLVTPDGVRVDGTQSIGIIRPPDVGQVAFSPDGTKFAYNGGHVSDLEIFDFDRCSGILSAPVRIISVDAYSLGGVAFSPNSRFLYASFTEDVYQYDMLAPDISLSVEHVAHWDGFYSPSPPLATLFDIAHLAPDGKVYIGTGNSTLHLHVIHDPDEPGFACHFEQHGIELSRFFMNSLPNHPNYHLGPLVGSACDTLGLSVNERGPKHPILVTAHPNPGSGPVTISYPAQAEAGQLELRDVQGRVVYQSRLPAWSQVHQLVLDGQATGMYHCQLRWGTRQGGVRILYSTP